MYMSIDSSSVYVLIRMFVFAVELYEFFIYMGINSLSDI